MLLAASASIAEARPWYVPDQAKLQLAGSIGFLSPGVGWASGRHTLEADVFFGWVPRAVAGDDILSVTGKVTLQPLRLGIGSVLLRPATVALQLTYTFGHGLFVRSPEPYGDGYYDFPTALHAGVAVGGSASLLTRGAVREVGLYWEAVALDTAIYAWHRNRRALGLLDLVTFAVGVRAAF